MSLEKIVNLAKRRGFVFPSSEIYGGFASCYDFGPLGVELKNNLKKLWWRSMVYENADIVGLDASILMHPKVWEASGHVENFSDPLVECKKCHKRFRADHLLEKQGMDPEMLASDPKEAVKKISCPECGGDFGVPRDFNLLMRTSVGPVEDTASLAYLRGETCQGIYVNFQNIVDTTHKSLPFGIAQVGKAFRNEITPGNFIFRMREFEQMEMQYFVHPDEAQKFFELWKEKRMRWHKVLGFKPESIRFRDHAPNERAHYAKAACDIEFSSSFGWKEFEGIHNRGDWDLSRHSQYSGKDLSYRDQRTGEKYIPWIIETSVGVDRAVLFHLMNAYEEISGGRGEDAVKESEVVLRLHPALAPVKAAVLPLSKKPALQKLAKDIFDSLKSGFMTVYDETGSIGKRYRRQDEIGTPYCITVDFESLDDHAMTVRERDSMKQERVNVAEIGKYFDEKFGI
ncbi:MAG: glycine--tRNA ligase [Parcubacteria group bacterium]|nr:glycine--tRNA ligase [Parcubacteria group bacterium]